MRRQALMVTAMVYGSFGVSRLLSIAIDGMPSESLSWATAIELFVGALCVLSLRRDSLVSLTMRDGPALDVNHAAAAEPAMADHAG